MNNDKVFNAGDKVKVIDGDGGLSVGAIFTVERMKPTGFVKLVGISGGFYTSRFELVPVKAATPVKAAAPNKSVSRLPNGRFKSTSTTERPTLLRRGAVYKVKRKRGAVLAKLQTQLNIRGVDYVVVAAHGKPFISRKANVLFANKAEVQQYLTAAK